MLPQHKIDRINELARKSKSDGLDPKEKEEQQKLRKEYLKAFRGDFKNQLRTIKVVDPEGNDVTPEKLKNEQKRNH
ncbi:DUF896 domain-containing protein [Pseudalkalibacillus decolorationis]|uniref:DUF896 domain-containing protein n=1 Tax=Pseudalkalibacillus decolorationis TaxID=163879 RepID=UPI00214917CC|nr:DUF896 domain-containing protein [Pseudalkalibacillus decolorationis]